MLLIVMATAALILFPTVIAICTKKPMEVVEKKIPDRDPFNRGGIVKLVQKRGLRRFGSWK